MRTITLELLRHGPAHNQLLSPLTPYLALCQNHGAVTLHVPFEHNQFLYRLNSLTYKAGEEARLFQLQDTAQVMGQILAGIPGLTAEANKEDQAGERLTHLRLILSASELALLPFELALSPSGLPGSGQHFLLQPEMPICLTREVRRVPGERFQWPAKPRILFAAAAPPEVGTIPLESHLQTLRQLIAPWVKYYPTAPAEELEDLRRKRLEEHLYFLPCASIQAIEEACSTGNFTHVHLLAHGVESKEAYDTRFFLALHDTRNPDKADYVSGNRLATALRAARKPGSRDLSRPAVVTLASCDSGNVGSVIGAGSSIAHALHEAGIPMVVAGQFPLSFAGSVRLVEVLYEGLLWGTDPRRLLYDLRRRLYSQFRTTHDWASLTVYVSLPEDFEQQLPDVKIEQAMGCVNAAMNHADEVLRQAYKSASDKDREAQEARGVDQIPNEVIERVQQKISDAKERLERLVADIPAQRARILGNLASTEKREAEILYSAGYATPEKDARMRYWNESFALLRQSREHYWQAFLLDRANSWAAVQYLSLTLILKRSLWFRDLSSPPPEIEGEETQPGSDLESLWSLARTLSGHDLQEKSLQARAWAHSSLSELYLLSLLMDEPEGERPESEDRRTTRPDAEQARQWALMHVAGLIETAGWEAFEVYSAWRQSLRYVYWFNEIASAGEDARKLAKEIFLRFPEGVEEKWK